MTQLDVRARLINSTIHVIADEGLDRASTKQIGIAASLNEAYIYRCFDDKADMFSKTFDSLDEELLAVAMKHFEIMHIEDMDFETRCRAYFAAVWRFLLGNREKCLTFVRYYYSTYFAGRSARGHENRFAPLVAKFKKAFIDEADVWMILNHILNVMLDFAVKVHNDQMSKEDNYSEHVFRVIYASVKQYFRDSEETKLEQHS